MVPLGTYKMAGPGTPVSESKLHGSIRLAETGPNPPGMLWQVFGRPRNYTTTTHFAELEDPKNEYRQIESTVSSASCSIDP